MECQACQLELEKLLCTLPSAWRKQVISVICGYIADQGMDCAKVAECIAADMTTLDYQCLADSQAEWDALTFNGKIQRIIDRVCAVAGLTLVTTANTNGIHLSGEGTATNALIATLQISSDAGNQAVIHSNGLFVPAAADIDICQEVQNAFADVRDQMNGSPRTGYEILARTNTGGDHDQGQCIELTPPTGFAVSGPGRVSAFGAMEWFDTLTLANADAATGETVLIYKNTTEDLTTVEGVSYFGIGNPSINDLTVSNSNAISISLCNLTILGDVSVGVSSIVVATNVKIYGQVTFLSAAKWSGGHFYDNTTGISLAATSEVRNIYSEKPISLTDSPTLNNFEINHTGAASAALTINCPGGFSVAKITNGKIKTTTAGGFGLNSYNDSSTVILQNIIGEATNGVGVYIQCGIQVGDTRTTTIVKNVTGIGSTIGIGIVSSRALGDTAETTTSFIVENIQGYGKTIAGISLINGTLAHSYGFSESGSGILVDGSDNPGKNINIMECIGESKGANGLLANKDVYIVGGTFISRLSTSSGNPIKINNESSRTGLFIAGAKTIAIHTSAYGIKAIAAITARISGCQFLNPNLTTAVPGIDPTITLNTVAIDAYGNMK